MRIGLIVLVATQLANLIFVPLFGHAGLALSIGLGACLNAGLLWTGLKKRGALPNSVGWKKYLLQLSAALVPFSLLLHFASSNYNWIALQNTPWIRIGLLSLWLGVAAIVYFAALGLVGIRWQKFLRHAK